VNKFLGLYVRNGPSVETLARFRIRRKREHIARDPGA